MIGFWWGLVGASSLLLGAALVFWRPPGQRLVGLVMAFGSGVLISAVAYDVVEDASTRASGLVLLAGLAGGALTFFVGDRIIDRMGGEGRKRSTGVQKESVQAAGGTGGAAIALGTVLDGIPESVVLGATLIGGGGVSVAMLADTMIPEATEFGGPVTGLVTVLGFATAFGLSSIGG